MKKLVGLYTGPEMLIDQPAYFDALKQEIGLTHVTGFSGYKLGGKTRAKNPMPPGGEEFAPSRGQDDDGAMRRGIDIAHDKDLKVWVCTNGWHGGGDRYPEMCMKDMHNRPISQVPKQRYARE